VRLTTLAIVVALVALLTACGDAPKSSPPGSPQNPLVGQTGPVSRYHSNEAASDHSETPGYGKLVERQSSHPRSRFSPCNLVTQAQAEAILGTSMVAPLEAPQGPTCIYRSRTGKHFVTLAVQTVDLAKLTREIRRPRRVAVSGGHAYCGMYGQPMLYAALSRRRVLSVSGPCEVAQQFADRAIRRLGA
jgi:hypothetical protein